MIDRYTKVMLTVIALALIGIIAGRLYREPKRNKDAAYSRAAHAIWWSLVVSQGDYSCL